ncbi:hypothetical protein [Prevotella nigrescens]|uniref:hypothetical protein n=1 Tax=Prevotella nigrescens TaxID=28133 RepID=UPI0028E71897|nr:hypothetical protein [Prevotella nigrescens]
MKTINAKKEREFATCCLSANFDLNGRKSAFVNFEEMKKHDDLTFLIFIKTLRIQGGFHKQV